MEQSQCYSKQFLESNDIDKINTIMNKKSSLVVDTIIFDVVPYLIAAAVVAALIIYMPQLVIGIALGYAACMWQGKLVSTKDKVLKKLDELKSKHDSSTSEGK